MSRSHSTRRSFQDFEILRKAFPGIRGPHEVNGDWTGVTSDKPRNLAVRIFFLGEIFYARSRGADAHLVSGEPWDARLGLVTRKQPQPHLPVQMAPEIKFESDESWTFTATAEGLDGEKRFLLYYRRPVYRSEIGRHVATISAGDKARLASELFGDL
jgi:hypothetical protein